MSIVIHQQMLDKLVHELHEVRVRTLHDIDSKLKRGIWGQVSIKFNAPSLFKYLIRWFGKYPICEELMVLQLMTLLLASEYGIEIIHFFTAERIIKELKKINVLIGSKPEFASFIMSITTQVEILNCSLGQDTKSVASSKAECVVSSMGIIPAEKSLNADDCLASRRQELIESLESHWKDKETLYTAFWEKPSSGITSKLDSFNDSLLLDESSNNVELAPGIVIAYTKDLTADYFLRPPYVCLSLFRVIRLRKVSVRAGFEMLLHLVESLRRRVRQRCTAALHMPAESIDPNEKTQISTCAFAYEVFRLGTELLKEITSDIDMMASNMIFVVLDNLTTFSLDGACSLMETLPVSRYKELRSDLGYLMKHFRQEWESNSKNVNSRTRYQMVLQIMVNSINHWKTLHGDTQPTIESISANGARTAVEYNAFDFATMNSTTHQRALEELDDTWAHEMHLALLDYPLKQACTSTYLHLLALSVNSQEDIEKLRVLGEVPRVFETVVDLLRAGPGALDMSVDELLDVGPDAIKTLFLHRSFGLMRMVMNAVAKGASAMTEDVPLWDTIESITVSLLAERDEEIRCEAYTLCTDMMKEFIGQLDEAAVLTRRTLSTNLPTKLRALGIPLSLRIVTEIICFGYTSSNSKIRQCAETMLLFLCNMKLFLRERWSSVEEILLPIAPLLQTAAIGCEETKLRKTVMGMFHPDFGLPWLDMLQGNLRLLYHEDSVIRTEALTRVMFLLSSIEQAEARLTPRIEHVVDTIPNELCLVKLPYDPRRQQVMGAYEPSTVRPLLDVLERDGSDPALRRSTLVHLNAMAADPVICDLIHNTSGWVLVLKALYNALREDHSIDYPDAAIPAVGILTKLCFSVVTFRRFLGTNENAYQLLVRSLFCFHHMPAFRVECCALLYLLLFADCSTGAGAMVSLPALSRSSAFRVPFVSHFHWEHSPFRQVNPLEVALQGGAFGGRALELSSWGGESILRIDARAPQQQQVSAGGSSVSQLSTYREYLMRYIRFVFADIWFQGLNKIVKACKNPQQTDATAEHDLAPIEYVGRVVGTPAFRFNSDLRLTKQDVRWLKIVDTASTLRKATRRIASAKTHAVVYSGLATLEANMLFPLSSAQSFPDQQSIISALQRYFVAPPATQDDQQLLVAVLSTVGNLIDFGQTEIRNWVIDMCNDGLFFHNLLRSETSCMELYAKTVRFLRVALFSLVPSDHVRKSEDARHSKRPLALWDVTMFHTVLQQIDVEMEANNYGRVCLLASLLEVLAETVAGKCVDVAQVTDKLLKHIWSVRSVNYVGSSILRSFLVTMRRLLGEDTIPIKVSTSYRRLLTLCGNSCPLTRACAWNVLAMLATKDSCAEIIVNVGDFLPGGIHACCVTTLLDMREACLVRQSAAVMLTNLLFHLVDKDGKVLELLLPQDGAYTGRPVDTYGPLTPLVTMLIKQRFFELSAASLAHFTPKEFLVEGPHAAVPESQQSVVSADLVKAYAIVYRALLEMELVYDFADVLLAKGCIRGLVSCITQHSLDNASIGQRLMVAEVCRLVAWFIDHPKRDELLKEVQNNQMFFARTISLLQPTEYSEHYALTKDAVLESRVNVIRMLNALLNTGLCRQTIRAAFAEANVKQIAQMILEGISTTAEDFSRFEQSECLDFLIAQSCDKLMSVNSPFMKLLEKVSMLADDDDDSPRAPVTSCDTDDSEEDQDEENKPREVEVTREQNPTATAQLLTHQPPKLRTAATVQHSGTGVIFKQLLNLFRHGIHVTVIDPELRKICIAMQFMLRTSPNCRLIAWEDGLLTTLLDCVTELHVNHLKGLSYPEFVRKYGEVKKLPHLTKFAELANILISWIGSPGVPRLLQPAAINSFCRMVLLYWSWIVGNTGLKKMIFEALAVLASDSIMVCQALAATFAGFPHSIMKLLIVTVTAETARVKGPNSDIPGLTIGMRVLMACCSCQEGRNTISKLHMLDNISKLHPSVTKMHKPWPEVTRLWLDFWELYSQEEDGCEVKHLTVLGALVRRSDLDLRLYALFIIRNLTFVPANRAALLASSDYWFMLQSALNRTAPREEQMTAAVTVWKLIANNHKGRAAIKASPLVRHIAALVNHHSVEAETPNEDELWNILMTVYRILQA